MLKKKSYTVICRGKNSYRAKSSIPPPHISLMVNHLEGGRRNGFDTSVNVIHQQMAGARSSCGGFQDQSFAFQDWKHADKRQMERESSKECSVSFLWTNKSFSLWNCLSRNSTLFSTRRIGALGLFWTNQGSEVSEDTWGTFRTLWSKESTILKRTFCIYKGFMDVFYILTSAWKKNHKMCIWNWFFAMCSADLTCENGSTI